MYLFVLYNEKDKWMIGCGPHSEDAKFEQS